MVMKTQLTFLIVHERSHNVRSELQRQWGGSADVKFRTLYRDDLGESQLRDMNRHVRRLTEIVRRLGSPVDFVVLTGPKILIVPVVVWVLRNSPDTKFLAFSKGSYAEIDPHKIIGSLKSDVSRREVEVHEDVESYKVA